MDNGATFRGRGVTFGATALGTAAIKMVGRGDVGALPTLAPYLFAFANLVVATIAIGTVYLIVRGRFIPISQPLAKAASDQ